ncbi:MAG: rane-bound lytic murein transglycosylase, partial [Pseudomonadota bacterium]
RIATPSTAAERPVRGPSQLRYRVQAGDTLYSLARRFEVKVEDLKRWNHLKGNTLQPGQKLVVHLRARA